ncbi:MAG TPA: MerR family transcriptional regulator [Trueperaceae bacterium]
MNRGKYTVNEVEDRTKVPGNTLRQWERRYGFPRPERSNAGYRLYSDIDLGHIEAMKQHISQGIPASRAAKLVQRMSLATTGPQGLRELQSALTDAFVLLDEARADSILAEAHALHTVESVVLEVLLGSLTELGQAHKQGRIGLATAGFAHSYVLGRLHALFRLGPARIDARLALVAGAPDERQEAGPLGLAVLLRRAGYLVRYFGADVPVTDLRELCARLRPDGVVLYADGEGSLEALLASRGQMAHLAPVVALAGAAFDQQPERAASLGGFSLGADVLGGLERFHALVRSGSGVHA